MSRTDVESEDRDPGGELGDRYVTLDAAEFSTGARGDEAAASGVDPVLAALAGSLRDQADRRSGRSPAGDDRRGDPFRPSGTVTDEPEGGPLLVGIAGSVAVGKSTVAATLADLIGPRVELVGTDAYLLPNEQLEPLGGAMRKGYPESYDWPALERFLVDARAGRSPLSTPLYSHDDFDIVPDRVRTFDAPDVLIVEGINLLQVAPAASGVALAVSDHLHRAIYLDATDELLEDWFVQRFVALTRPTGAEPSDFYRQFAELDDAGLDATARWVWNEINAPNLREHIRPSRDRAEVILEKGPAHRIARVHLRR